MRRSWSEYCCAAAAMAVAILAFARPVAAAEVKVEKIDQGLKITVDGEPFAEYLVKNGHQPIIWPIYSPAGKPMTRQHPMGDALPGEEEDHGHHRSLWFNHGLVNSHDFWLEPRRDREGQIVHREFTATESGETARVVARNDWMFNDEKVCEDERTFVFGADEHGRWIDFTVVVTASDGDVEFGDTKEGAFGLRVPGTMSVKSNKGGKIRNSNGQEDAVAWGQSAEWVDYSGPVEGEPAGIVIFDMPDSFRHPTSWHVRDYGLFAANPFGEKDFVPPDNHEQGTATVKEGDTLKLHYRVLFYDGKKSDRELAAINKEYAEE